MYTVTTIFASYNQLQLKMFLLTENHFYLLIQQVCVPNQLSVFDQTLLMHSCRH